MKLKVGTGMRSRRVERLTELGSNYIQRSGRGIEITVGCETKVW